MHTSGTSALVQSMEIGKPLPPTQTKIDGKNSPSVSFFVNWELRRVIVYTKLTNTERTLTCTLPFRWFDILEQRII